MENIEIRTATTRDAEALLEIYSHYVRYTAVTFEYEPPTLAEFRGRMIHILEKYPYLCVLEDHRIMGYAYAGAFHERAAYQWSAEMTIYLSPGAQKRGLGRKLYEKLEDKLRELGILNLYACIGYPTEDDEYLTKNSAAFHEHLGYAKIGEFHNCGYKFNRWYNMIYMEKIIGKHTSPKA